MIIKARGINMINHIDLIFLNISLIAINNDRSIEGITVK